MTWIRILNDPRFKRLQANARATQESIAAEVLAREFSVYQFFPDDTYERVLHFVGAQEAVECAKRLSVSVGGRLGTTRRIIITDGGDHPCFEWKHGEGVTYPPLSATFPPRDPAPAPGSSESSAKL